MAHYKTAGRRALVGPVASLPGLGLEPTVYSASCGSLRTAQCTRAAPWTDVHFARTATLRPKSWMAHQKRHLASDPAHASAPPSAVRAHGHKSVPRAPRRRNAIARRLETDLPFLSLACGGSVARCGGARPGAKIPAADLRGLSATSSRKPAEPRPRALSNTRTFPRTISRWPEPFPGTISRNLPR